MTGVCALLAGCSAAGSAGATATGSALATPSGQSAGGAPTTTTSATSAGPTPSSSPTSAQSCTQRLVGELTPAQQVGQLVWVAVTPQSDRSETDHLIQSLQIGGVLLLGHWNGATAVRKEVEHLQSLTAGSRLALVISTDQEGGLVQDLSGHGFSTIPRATEQGTLSPAALTAAAKTWGAQLRDAGVNLDLAPVAGTVPASLGTKNGPIGRYDREFSFDPAHNATMVAAFVTGMHQGGEATTVKHFPGLGRIVNNTDTSKTGITDPTTGPGDPYLAPFAAGIAAGTDAVMVGSAIYPRFDPDHHAVFSSAIITGLLRTTMGYDGLVVSDELGAAAAVSDTPMSRRAADFVAAGGDVTLIRPHEDVVPMVAGLLARLGSSRDFADQVRRAAQRAIALKTHLGLATCA